jgi:hypothetical protein
LRAYLTQGLAAVSRGPGRLERAIRALCDANPDAVFATEELAAHCYPAAPEIERKHLVAVRRAMRHVLHWESEPTGWGNFGALYARHIYANIDSSRGLGRAFAMRELDEIERSQSVASRVAMLTEQQLPDGDQGVAVPAAILTALAALARRLVTENDPDVIRTGLAEIANALDPPADAELAADVDSLRPPLPAD